MRGEEEGCIEPNDSSTNYYDRVVRLYHDFGNGVDCELQEQRWLIYNLVNDRL